jgi:protein-tyrosine-phosphatase
MASWFGSFAGGFAKGMVEQLTEKEKEQAAMTAASIKNMYHNVQEKKKEIANQAEEYRGTVSTLGSFKFKDGTKFDDRQLITLASNPEMAKSVIKHLQDDPELSARLTPDFFKAAENAPTGVKASEYMDKLFKVQAAATDQTKELFNTAAKGGSIVDNLAAGNGYAQAQKAAAAYGMTLEQLVGYQSVNTKRTPDMIGDIDYSKLAKTKGFDDVASQIKLEYFNADTEEGQKQAVAKLARLKTADAAMKLEGKTTEEDKRSKLADEAQDPTKSPQERAIAAALLQQRIKMFSNPKENNEEKVTQANLITVASRGFASTLESLAPGKFVTSTDMQGNISVMPKGIADPQMKAAYAQARNGIINEFTSPDGKPKSVTARNALVSIGVQFDADGKAIPAKPENVLMGAVPTPIPSDAPARGGPMQPKPATPAAPAAPTASSLPKPKTQAEYNAIPKGTRYIDTDGLEKIKG